MIKVGIGEVRSDQAAAIELYGPHIRAGEVRAGEVCVFHFIFVDTEEIRAGKVRVCQVHTIEERALQFHAS